MMTFPLGVLRKVRPSLAPILHQPTGSPAAASCVITTFYENGQRQRIVGMSTAGRNGRHIVGRTSPFFAERSVRLDDVRC